MPIYNFRAKKVDEEEFIEGSVEAESESLASEILEERGLIVLSIEQKKKNLFELDFLERVNTKDLVIFARQLSVMISAQVPLVQSLKDIVKQDINKKLKRVVAEVATEVEGGIKFSEALARHSKFFDNFFVNIVRSGESSGRLEEVLMYLADQLEKDYEMKGKIKGAMIYPAFIVSGMMVLGIFVMVFIIPKMTEMLAQTGAELPLSTRILKGLSDFLVQYGWMLLMFAIIFAVIARMVIKTESGRRSVDLLKLNLPIFGKLNQYILVIRFVRGLRTLLLGGVDIVEALNITAALVDNLIYRDLILEAVSVIEDGGSMSETFEKSKYVPKIVSQMLRTGEETGKVDMVLEKISQFYSREVDSLIGNLMALMEPIIMVVLGVAVGVMIAAVVMPMYQVSTNM
ncbi:type II secretion system F family protein [Patescibacteria group bacterium]|nr:type II secretion system F family protein [Patescibacteria group bacterium]